MEALEPLAGEELERMLARYARVRLEPSLGQARRARAAIMEEAWRRHLDPQSLLRSPSNSATLARPAVARRRPFRGWGPRRVGGAFAAAALAGLMIGSSVFAASRAGGPLYQSRLALESLTLPGDPAARVAAQLAWADARLGEAVEAGFRHDEHAVAAALDAYDEVVLDLTSASGASADDALAAILLHRAVLLQLASELPSSAASGIDLALTNSDRAIVRLGSAGARGSGSDGNHQPAGNGFGTDGAGSAAGGTGIGRDGGNAGGNGNGNANGAGNGSGAAAATPAPTRTPAPSHTPRPAATPKPEPTPAATQKPNSGPQGTPHPTHTTKPHRPSPTPRDGPTPQSVSPEPSGSDSP